MVVLGMKIHAHHAAKNGHLEVLKWARDNGCPWNKYTCVFAAQNGHLEILRWAHNNGCPWDKYTTYAAVSHGQMEILIWALNNNCPYDIKMIDNLFKIVLKTVDIKQEVREMIPKMEEIIQKMEQSKFKNPF